MDRLAFNVDANYLGATIKDVPGAGNNCMFLALAHQMLIQDVPSIVCARDLRRQSVAFLERHADVQWDARQGGSTYGGVILANHNSFFTTRVYTWREYLDELSAGAYYTKDEHGRGGTRSYTCTTTQAEKILKAYKDVGVYLIEGVDIELVATPSFAPCPGSDEDDN